MRICYNITMNFGTFFRDIPLRIKNKTKNVVKQTRFFFFDGRREYMFRLLNFDFLKLLI